MKKGDAVEPKTEKVLEPNLALEKILKQDRKHSNFDYYDPARNVHFRVQNPPLLNDAPHAEHQLRFFWRHAQNSYFRMPQQAQLQRLVYFQSILNQELSHELHFQPNQEYWRHLELVFDQDYLRKQISELETNLDSQNWFYTLYLYYRLLENQEGKPNKKLEKEYKQIKGIKQNLQNMNNRKFNESLKIENQQLIKHLPQLNQDNDEVAQEIRRLQQQLEDYHPNTVRLLNQLQQRTSKQIILKTPLYCFGEEEYEIEEQHYESDEVIIQKRLEQAEVQMRYIEYMIGIMEKKNIAESISKILKVEKARGEPKFLVSFEKAMNVKNKIMTQSQLLKLNKFRQYSLLKFYNTALKTPYSFITQNFCGFNMIYLNRNESCKFKEANMLEQMKRNSFQSSQASKGFEQFETCHHCKLLFPQSSLIKCKYSSDKLGSPILPAAYCDSYLTQLSKSTNGKQVVQATKTQRYQLRRRNHLQNYTKLGQQYTCGRAYCRFCAKQNYQQCFDKFGCCPFCKGVCYCSRCSRNDIIVKLKSYYLLLGGQISKIQYDQNFEMINFEDIEQEQKQIKKKGRPKKVQKRSTSAPNKAYEHLKTIRVQLQPLRLLCDLVKKRQKKKEKLIKSEQEFFIQKIGMMSRDFANIIKSGRQNHDDTFQQNSEENQNRPKNNNINELMIRRRRSKRI